MIREATLDDVYTIMKLALPWFRESDIKATFSEQRTIQTIIDILQDPDSYVFLHGDSGLIYLTVEMSFFEEPVGNIRMFFVHPDARGTTVSRDLVRHARDFALQKGACIINADTIFTKHAKSYSNLFKKFGFKFSGYNLIYG